MRKKGILFVTFLLLISSTGCIDVYLIEDILNKIDPEDPPVVRWVDKLEVDGTFEITLENPNPEVDDFSRILGKFVTNISEGNLDNIQKILQEENIAFKKDVHDFYIEKDTDAIRLEIDADWRSLLAGDQGWGYFEITVRNEGKIIMQDSYPSTEPHFSDTIPLNPNSGNWTVEIGGTGGPDYLATFYGGRYNLTVKAHEPDI